MEISESPGGPPKITSEESKNSEEAEEDPVAVRHELLLHEIEAIEEYWGPTFRWVGDFLAQVDNQQVSDCIYFHKIP